MAAGNPAAGDRSVMMNTSPSIAIVGGGISGLAAAYELSERGLPFVLYDRAPRLGGVIVTERAGGYTIDAGPDALLTQKPAALALCRTIGLDTRLLAQQARATYVVRAGRLHRLPDTSVLGIPMKWLPFVISGAFSMRGEAEDGSRGRVAGARVRP